MNFYGRHAEPEIDYAALSTEELMRRDKTLDISDLGIQQAIEKGENLQDANIKMIVHSDFFRSKRTAQEVQRVLGGALIEDVRMGEVNFGKNTLQNLKGWLKHGNLGGQISGAESIIDVRKRWDSVRSEMIDKIDGSVLFEGHKLLGSVVQLSEAGLPYDALVSDLPNNIKLYYGEYLALGN